MSDWKCSGCGGEHPSGTVCPWTEKIVVCPTCKGAGKVKRKRRQGDI